MHTPEENTPKHTDQKDTIPFDHISAGRASLPTPQMRTKESSEIKGCTPNNQKK